MSVLIDSLLKIGFLTGSRAFGTARMDSDWDIVYQVNDSSKIDDLIKGYERTESDYNNGFSIMERDGTQINLIPVHPHEFLPWYLTTEAFKVTFKKSGITDPNKKYALFEIMTGAFRGFIDSHNCTADYDRIKNHILKGTLL